MLSLPYHFLYQLMYHYVLDSFTLQKPGHQPMQILHVY